MANRLALVVDGPLDQPTGGYIYDAMIAQGLSERGTPVRVVSLEAGGTITEHNRLAGELANADASEAVVVDELCHPRATLAVVAHRARRRKGRAPVVVLVHHLAASERTGAARASRLVVEGALLAAADRIVTTSETTRDVITRLGISGSRVRVAPPGCDRLGWANGIAPNSQGVRFLALGSVTPRKGVLELVRAFEWVRSGATLTVVGPLDRHPAYARSVVEASKNLGGRVRLLGEIGKDALERELRQNDVLVTLSRYEGYGMAVAEALAHGLAVVALRAGALPEVIGIGEHAHWLDEAEGARDVLSHLANDPARVFAMRQKSVERGRALPTWKDTTSAFHAAIADL